MSNELVKRLQKMAHDYYVFGGWEWDALNEAISALSAQQSQVPVAWAVRNKKDGYWAGIWNNRECADRVCSKGNGDDEILAMRQGDCNADVLQSEAQRTLMPPDTSNRITKERK